MRPNAYRHSALSPNMRVLPMRVSIFFGERSFLASSPGTAFPSRMRPHSPSIVICAFEYIRWASGFAVSHSCLTDGSKHVARSPTRNASYHRAFRAFRYTLPFRNPAYSDRSPLLFRHRSVSLGPFDVIRDRVTLLFADAKPDTRQSEARYPFHGLDAGGWCS